MSCGEVRTMTTTSLDYFTSGHVVLVDRARQTEIESLAIENELAVARLRERDQRRRGAARKWLASYKIDFLHRCITHQASAHQNMLRLAHVAQRATIQSLKSVHETTLQTAREREHLASKKRTDELERLYEQRMLMASAELENSLKEAQVQNEQLEHQLDARVKDTQRLTQEVESLHNRTRRLQAELTDAEAELKRAEDTTSSLSKENDLQRTRDEKQLNVRDDIWKRKLEIWKKSHENDQIKWANENVDLQLRIATLEKQLSAHALDSTLSESSNVKLKKLHTPNVEPPESAGMSPIDVTVATSPDAQATSSVKALPRTSDDNVNNEKESPLVTVETAPPLRHLPTQSRKETSSSKQQNTAVNSARPTGMSAVAKKTRSLVQSRAPLLTPLVETSELEVNDKARNSSSQNSRAVTHAVTKKRRVLSGARKHTFDPFKRAQTKKSNGSDEDDDEEIEGRQNIFSAFAASANSGPRGQKRTIEKLNALIGNFAAKK